MNKTTYLTRDRNIVKDEKDAYWIVVNSDDGKESWSYGPKGVKKPA